MCYIKHVKWQEFQDSPYVARVSEIQVIKKTPKHIWRSSFQIISLIPIKYNINI